MSRFRFALDPLLEARRRAEREHQRAVAAIERERLDLERRLRGQQRRLAEGKTLVRDQLVGTLAPEALRGQASAAMQVMRAAQRTLLELAGVHRRLEAARAGLVEATRRRRAIELLRERRYEAWRRAQEKAETAAVDELAVIAAARRETDP